MHRRLLTEAMAMPWAILPSRLADIMAVLARFDVGHKLSPDEIRAAIGDRAAHGDPRASDAGGGIAVLGLRGIIANRIEQVNNISGPGGTSTEGFSRRLNEALGNPNIAQIVIDIDSPGGGVTGVPELALEINEASAIKPVHAIANSLAASAAYWLGSAASSLSVTPSGDVGSIGVFTSHTDISGKLEQSGESITLISAGEFKTEGHPFGPLTDTARDHLQSRVDDIYSDFIDYVAMFRGVTSATVRGDFGRGRTVTARDALAAGMVDYIETMPELLSRISAHSPSNGGARTRAGYQPGTFAYMGADYFDD